MEHKENNENKNPKSLGRLGFNTAFKNNFQLKNNIFSKNQKNEPRTPLKSTINLMNNNSQIPMDNKNNKCLKYPLLKSISSSNININHNKINNTNNNIYNNNDDEKYNENALEDEPEDFMHMNENEIYINNNEENYEDPLNIPKANLKLENIFENILDSNYTLAAHFDEEGKKKYDDYFNSPDEEDDVIDSDN